MDMSAITADVLSVDGHDADAAELSRPTDAVRVPLFPGRRSRHRRWLRLRALRPVRGESVTSLKYLLW